MRETTKQPTPKLIESPYNAILGLTQKFILSRVLMIFSELELGKLLHDKPLSLSAISDKLRVHPIALQRFLRLLTAHNVLLDIGNDTYSTTSISLNFDQIQQANLVRDYIKLDKALDELKNNKNPKWSAEFGEYLTLFLNKYLSLSQNILTDELMLLANGFVLSRVIMAAAELRLDKILEDKPLLLSEIANILNIDTEILKPFLQVLVKHEVLVAHNGTYSSTTLSQSLNRVLGPHILDGYKVFNHALNTLQNNCGSWEHTFSQSFYSFLNSNPDKLQMFQEWCVQSAIDWLPPILSMCDLPSHNTLIDVGGGIGHFLASVLKKNPHMNGVLFDQPSVIAGVETSPIFDDLQNRVRFIGGDFFKNIPEGGDIYTICRTLLNWNDEKSIEIINNCHKAMKGKGRLWIIDFLIPDEHHPKYPRAVINDISLFVILNSTIRTKTEWQKLIDKSLFTISNIYITTEEIKPEPYYPMCIIECQAR